MNFIHDEYLNRFTEPQPGRTVSMAYAFQTLVQDIKQSIHHQDSSDDASNLKECLNILEEHLSKTFYSEEAGRLKAYAWRSGYDWHIQVEGFEKNHGDSYLSQGPVPDNELDRWIKSRPWMAVKKEV